MSAVRAPARRQAGLSLVEAVVALALLALLVALSVGGWSLIDNRRLAGAARTLATDIRFVEQRARAERRCWRVTFEPANARYRLAFTTAAWTAAGGCPADGWADYRVAELPGRVGLVSTTFGSDRMVVSPFGNPNAGTVVLRTPGGAERRVVVTPGGRVTITP